MTPGSLQARGMKKAAQMDGRIFAVGAQLPATAAYWVGWKGARLAMLPRTEDDATMTYVYSTAPPG